MQVSGPSFCSAAHGCASTRAGCEPDPWRGTQRAMSTPQDGPNRKKQKARAARKLANWRKKQAERKSGEAKDPSSTSKKA